jgi:excinuclease ABC subunit B
MVIMYADNITGSMERAIKVTRDRREVQERYNTEHGITPTSIQKAIEERMHDEEEAETADVKAIDFAKVPKDELKYLQRQLKEQMQLAAANLQFEKAAELRDQLGEIDDVIQGKRMSK